MVSGMGAQDKSLCSGSRIVMGYWPRRRSRNSAASARNIELRINMNIPAMPSRNSGLADRNITKDHHRLESCTKTDKRSGKAHVQVVVGVPLSAKPVPHFAVAETQFPGRVELILNLRLELIRTIRATAAA